MSVWRAGRRRRRRGSYRLYRLLTYSGIAWRAQHAVLSFGLLISPTRHMMNATIDARGNEARASAGQEQ